MATEWEIIKGIDPFGKITYVVREKPDNGAGCFLYLLLIIGLIIFVLGTFVLPYNLVCTEISSYSLEWIKNENVWIFSFLFWVLLFSAYIFIKAIVVNLGDKYVFDEIFEFPFITIPLLFTSLSVSILYIAKSAFSESFIIFSSAFGFLLLSFLHVVVRYSKNKYLPIFYIYVILMYVFSFFYIKEKDNLHEVKRQTVNIEISK